MYIGSDARRHLSTPTTKVVYRGTRVRYGALMEPSGRNQWQPEAQGGKEKRRERLEADVNHDKVHRPTDRDDKR